MSRLVLFDIDGTLLSAGAISRRALVPALEEVFGTAGEVDGYEFSGKTDPQIVRELMNAAGIAAAAIEARVDDALERYRDRLVNEISPRDVRAKPGVENVLEALVVTEVTLALLTGNIEECAWAKLEPLGFEKYFAFGVFGSDHADRYELPALARDRARQRTGRAYRGKEIVVIGDSIHDVRCGRAIGVKSVAVATGVTPIEKLAAEQPDALFPDWSDAAAIVRAILD